MNKNNAFCQNDDFLKFCVLIDVIQSYISANYYKLLASWLAKIMFGFLATLNFLPSPSPPSTGLYGLGTVGAVRADQSDYRPKSEKITVKCSNFGSNKIHSSKS